MLKEINEAASKISARQKEMPAGQSVLVGISGIDAGGKGFITKRIEKLLGAQNINIANINIDGWLNLPHVRFDPSNPAGNLDRMFV